MVNFRFHLVSLTAVFLALAAGITIGAGVVDRATVDQIQRQLSDVAQRREETNAENDQLREELGRWTRFSEEAGDQLVAGQLTDVPVVVLASNGIDRALVDAVEGSLGAAGAQLDGTLWLTTRWVLDDDEERRALAGALDVAPTTEADDLRSAGIAGLTTAWAVGDGGPLVPGLLDAGFLEYETSSQVPVPLVELPRPDTLFVVISGDPAEVAPADLTVPLASRLALSQVQLVAVQPQRPPVPEPAEGADEEEPATFVAQLRDDAVVASRISTVDNVDDYRGRVALVLALRDLRIGTTGHYGVGPDARLVAEPPTA
ncbi:MAG TPA: copper transporter [Acidimicrobiales bacterium]|nr:copper transporter [Acidimicrobiales bacterium]